jgi:hypothetical protein
MTGGECEKGGTVYKEIRLRWCRKRNKEEMRR